MTISETIEKVVQKLGGSVKFRKTPNGDDLFVYYTEEPEGCTFFGDRVIDSTPYTLFISVGDQEYIVPIKTFVTSRDRGTEEAFEAFLYNIFASIF